MTRCVRCNANLIESEEVLDLIRKAIMFGYASTCEGGNRECDVHNVDESLKANGLKDFLIVLEKGELT